MTTPNIEKRRLAALDRLNLLDTPPEERFERLTRIARQYYQVKIALFTIVDNERQWFKSRQGLDTPETPRSVAFCDYAIQQDKVLLVEDATKDPRFSKNPLVSGKPRQLNEVDLDVLRNLASIVEDDRAQTALSGKTRTPEES